MFTRSQRINELIKEEIGQIFLREVEFPEGSLVTVTRVETAQDLSSARVFISVFPENFSPSVLRQLTSRIYFLQQKLNRQLLIRPVPRLVFCSEKTTGQAGRIEELLEQAKERSVEKKRKKR